MELKNGQVIAPEIGPKVLRIGNGYTVQYPTIGDAGDGYRKVIANRYGHFDTREEALAYIARVWKLDHA